MVKYLFIALAIVIIISLALFFYEIKHAKLVDPNEPLLHGDYEGKDLEGSS